MLTCTFNIPLLQMADINQTVYYCTLEVGDINWFNYLPQMQVHKRTKNSTCFYQKTEEYTKPQDLSVAKKLMEGSSVWFCVLYNNTGNVILIVKSFFCDLRLYNIFTTSIRERHISILSTRNVYGRWGGGGGCWRP